MVLSCARTLVSRGTAQANAEEMSKCGQDSKCMQYIEESRMRCKRHEIVRDGHVDAMMRDDGGTCAPVNLGGIEPIALEHGEHHVEPASA